MQSIRKQYAALILACWHYIGDRKHWMIFIYLMFIGANICFMAQPYVIGKLINVLQQGGDNLLNQVIFWLSLYVGSMLGFWVFHGPSRVIEQKLAFEARRNFNLHYYNLLTRMPIRWHQDHHSGNTINRIQKSSTAFFNFAANQFLFFNTMLRGMIVLLALMFVDWRVSLTLFIFSILLFYILRWFDFIIMRKIHTINEGEHIFSAAQFDFISNIYNVITFNLVQKTTTHLRKAISNFYPPFREENIINECKWFVMMNLLVIIQFCILLFYIWYHLQPGQILMLGTLVTLFQYMQRFDTAFNRFAELSLKITQHYTDFFAVKPLDDDFKEVGTTDDDLPDLAVTNGAIDFNKITFAYDGQNHIFDKLDLHIKAGERIGLIGPSGAGKTSLVNLLLRFDAQQDLDITIDGQNIYDVNAESLRANIALIPQDTTLFQASLMDNIRDGRLEASDEEVIAAAKAAHAHEFIAVLPQGYDTFVGERGVKLSGGQRQRIAIARALLKDAPILVLDEATSALDSESEKLVQASFETLMQGKTVIAIAHRLSTIAHLDRLIVMDQGKIVETGTHNELLAQNGTYARLWGMQSGGFLGE